MLTYSSLAALYLIYLGLAGEWLGNLLWPAVTAHAILTILLVRVWVKESRDRSRKTQESTACNLASSEDQSRN